MTDRFEREIQTKKKRPDEHKVLTLRLQQERDDLEKHMTLRRDKKKENLTRKMLEHERWENCLFKGVAIQLLRRVLINRMHASRDDSFENVQCRTRPRKSLHTYRTTFLLQKKNEAK